MVSESAINSLLINNYQFEYLKEQLNEFNPFRILRITDHELRHSNVLAWLFDPNGNHNLGTTILKKVLLDILMDPENEQNIPENLRIQDIYNSELLDAKVFRERDNIDIFVISESNSLVIYFENKLRSQQTKEQLEKYYKVVIKEYGLKQFNILPVLLTMTGEEPLHEKYCRYDHSSIYNIVSDSISLYKNKIQPEVLQFIRYYQKNLKDLLMDDERIEKFCKEIYSNHKEVIDLIYNIGNKIDISDAFDDFKSIHKEVSETFRSNKSFWFNISEFRIETKPGTEKWGDGYPFSYWFDIYGQTKLKIVLEIGPFNNQDLRDKFLIHLDNYDVALSPRAKEPGRYYARICTDTKRINDWSNRDEEAIAMVNLYNKKIMQNSQKKLVSAINDFDWK